MKLRMRLTLAVIALAFALAYPLTEQASPPGDKEALEAYLKVFPGAKRIGVIYSSAAVEESANKLEELAKAKDIALLKFKAESLKDFPKACQDMTGKVDTVWVYNDPVFASQDAWIYFVMFTMRNRLRTVVYTEQMLSFGGLFHLNEEKGVMINKRIMEALNLKAASTEGEITYVGEGN